MKKYVAKKAFLHDQLGRVEKGAEFEASVAQIGGVLHLVSEVKPKATETAKKPDKKND